MRAKGEHEIFCCGSLVRISEKGVKVLTEPRVQYCPLHEALYGTRRIDADAVRRSVKVKMAAYGFCCTNRTFEADSIVPYGASEMMRVLLENGLIDCAVVVCEGAGTVITTNGKLVQGIGARLTGIVRTSPIRETIQHIESNGGIILDSVVALIDQVEGVKHAFKLGYRRIAVSVAGFEPKAIDEIRKFERSSGSDVLIFSVCNTCVRLSDVKHVARSDIVCASASKILRKEIGSRALLQLGVAIPVYALSQRGKKLALAYLAHFDEKLVIFRTQALPYLAKTRNPGLRKISQGSRI